MPQLIRGLLLFVFLFTSVLAFAQLLADSTVQQVDHLFGKWQGSEAPGCAVGIIRGNQLVYAKGFGLANLENKQPITPNSLFYICSLSKQFTGYAAALLIQAGKIKLTDDCRKYLPWLSDFGHLLTIEHLLYHTSGLRDDIHLAEFYGLNPDGVLTQALALHILKGQRTLNFVPGEKFSYSNSNYVLLAEIIKTVSGMSFEAFADSAIFGPLQMSNSRFVSHSQELIPGRVASYERHKEAYKNATQTVYTLGDGGMFSNVVDMAKWTNNFFYPRVGDSHTLALMTKPGQLSSGKPLKYAMGINVDSYEGHKRLIHNGGLAGYRTILAVFPDLQVGLIIFGNGADSELYSKIDQLSALLIGKKITASHRTQAGTASVDRVEIDSVTLSRWRGDYIAANGYRLRISLINGRLHLNDTQELTAEAAHCFHLTNRPAVSYQFEVDRKGKAVGLRLSSPILDIPMELSKVEETELTKGMLDSYVGVYYSDELEATVRVSRRADQLWVSTSRHAEAQISWIGGDHLYTDYAFISHLLFKRDVNNGIIGFEVNSGELMHLHFRKQK